ncbi:MAG: hypothetical protein KDD51_11870 [Bdellovibrionales bacterium]|nr:hypothetical protein [Bdellovibrionales bacterium]
MKWIAALTSCFLFLSIAALAKDPTATEAIQEQQNSFGSFNLNTSQSESSQTYLESLVSELRLPGDPQFKVFFVNHPSDFIAVGREIEFDAEGKPYKPIVIAHGAIAEAPNEDRLMAKIAHEIAHSDAEAGRTVGQVRVQMQREELLVADKGAMERMAQAGRDPRALRSYFIDLISGRRRRGLGVPSPMTRPEIRAGLSAIHSHPPEEFRVTFAERWLTENESRFDYADPKPAPAAMRTIQASHAYMFPETEAPEPQAPPPLRGQHPDMTVHFRDVLARLEEEPPFKALDAFAKLTVLAEISHMEITYHGLIWRYFGNPELLDSGISIGSYIGSDARHFARTYVERFDTSNRFHQGRVDPYFIHYQDGNSLTANEAALSPMRLAKMDNDDEAAVVKVVRSAIQGRTDRETLERAIEVLSELANQVRYSGNEPRASTDLLAVVRRQASPIPHVTRVSQLVGIQARRKDGSSRNAPLDDATYRRELVRTVHEYPSDENFADFVHAINETYGFHDNVFEPGDRERLVGMAPEIVRVLLDRRGGLLETGFRAGPYPPGFKEVFGREIKRQAIDSGTIGRARKIHIALNWAELPGMALSDTIPRIYPTPTELLAALERNEIPFFNYGTEKRLLSIAKSMDTTWTLENILKLLEHEKLWNKDGVTAQKLMEFGEVAGQRDFGGIKPVIQQITDEHRDRFSGPTYEYNVRHSRDVQEWVLGTLQTCDCLPEDGPDRHRLFVALASRGATLPTDDLAQDWYLREGTSSTVDQLADLLEKQLVWDFPTRLKIYNRWRELSGVHPPQVGRQAWIEAEAARLDRYFPESSPARAQAFEDFAHTVEANFAETKYLSAQKYREDANVESMALRAFSAVFTLITEYRPREWGDPSPAELKLQLIKFVLGKGEAPQILTESAQLRHLQPERLQKVFLGLPPEIRAVVLNPLLAKPHGLYTHEETRQQLVGLVVQNTGEYKDQAKLLVNALLYGLNKTAEFQETLALSFLLGQSAESRSMSDGERLRILLESMGSTGVALAQRLYQRRLVPAEFLEHLANTQDQSRRPDRLDLFMKVSEILGTDDPDKVIHIVRVLGSASAKSVLEVQYLDGRISRDQLRALKLLRDNLLRTNRQEAEKVRHMIDYLVEHGGSDYRPLVSVFKDIKRALDLQADSQAECRNCATVSRIYHSGEVDRHGFLWRVVQPDLELGSSERHSHEEVAGGIPLKQLTLEQKRKVFPAIAAMEESILLTQRHFEGQDFYFERDRHMGNFKVDFSTEPPTIWVYDYPLLSRISKKRAAAIFQLFGLSELYATASPPVSHSVLLDEIIRILTDDLPEKPGFATARLRMRRDLEERLTSENLVKSQDPVARVLDILAVAEKVGMEPHPSVNDYLAALQNWERYASDSGEQAVSTHFSETLIAEVSQHTEARLRGRARPSQVCLRAFDAIVEAVISPFVRR